MSMRFYEECGFLSVGSKNGSYITNYKVNADALEHPHITLSDAELGREFSYMRFDSTDEGVFSPNDSGYINPRPLVQAQIKIAEKHGCHFINSVVDRIDHDGSNEGHEVKIATGRTLLTRKVILATGAFTFSRKLIPDGTLPDIFINPNTVILVEVDKEEMQELKRMPSVIYKGGTHDRETLSFVCYILPPIQYPDGKYYLKMGHGSDTPPKYQLKTPQALHSWYCHGKTPDIEDMLVNMVKEIFPGLKMKRYHFDYCCTTRTLSNHPYISMLSPSFGVALGGCGHAAKSSDEIGLMAARMISKGSWNHDLPENKFRFVGKPVSNL